LQEWQTKYQTKCDEIGRLHAELEQARSSKLSSVGSPGRQPAAFQAGKVTSLVSPARDSSLEVSGWDEPSPGRSPPSARTSPQLARNPPVPESQHQPAGDVVETVSDVESDWDDDDGSKGDVIEMLPTSAKSAQPQSKVSGGLPPLVPVSKTKVEDAKQLSPLSSTLSSASGSADRVKEPWKVSVAENVQSFDAKSAANPVLVSSSSGKASAGSTAAASEKSRVMVGTYTIESDSEDDEGTHSSRQPAVELAKPFLEPSSNRKGSGPSRSAEVVPDITDITDDFDEPDSAKLQRESHSATYLQPHVASTRQPGLMSEPSVMSSPPRRTLTSDIPDEHEGERVHSGSVGDPQYDAYGDDFDDGDNYNDEPPVPDSVRGALVLIDRLTPGDLENLCSLKKITDVVAVIAGAVSAMCMLQCYSVNGVSSRL
jgi:hypothetical protein